MPPRTAPQICVFWGANGLHNTPNLDPAAVYDSPTVNAPTTVPQSFNRDPINLTAMSTSCTVSGVLELIETLRNRTFHEFFRSCYKTVVASLFFVSCLHRIYCCTLCSAVVWVQLLYCNHSCTCLSVLRTSLHFVCQ